MSLVERALLIFKGLLNQHQEETDKTGKTDRTASGARTSEQATHLRSGSSGGQVLFSHAHAPRLRQTLTAAAQSEDPMLEAKELSNVLHDLIKSFLEGQVEAVYKSVQLSQPRFIAEPTLHIPNVQRAPVKSSYYRWRASTTMRSLSVRASHGMVELFIIPTDDVPLRAISEYGSRFKARFELVQRSKEGFVWLLDKKKVGSEEAINLIQRCLDEVVGKIIPEEEKIETQLLDRSRPTDRVQQLLLEKQNLIFKMLNEQEILKNELARTLHDTVLADLLMLKRHLRGDQELNKEEIIETVDEIAQQLRDVCNECAPRNLHDWGLKTSLQDLLQRMEQRTGIKCVLTCDLELPNMPANVELHLFRLMQEALNNVEKHAGARRVEISIEKRGQKSLRFSVIDNGKGISSSATKEKSTDSGGMGVAGMRERADLIRVYFPVVFGVTSAEGEGTTVFTEIKVPDLDV